MTVRIELTSRLAEIAGFAGDSLDVSSPRTLRDALIAVEQRLVCGSGSELLARGRLHPSIRRLERMRVYARRRERSASRRRNNSPHASRSRGMKCRLS